MVGGTLPISDFGRRTIHAGKKRVLDAEEKARQDALRQARLEQQKQEAANPQSDYVTGDFQEYPELANVEEAKPSKPQKVEEDYDPSKEGHDVSVLVCHVDLGLVCFDPENERPRRCWHGLASRVETPARQGTVLLGCLSLQPGGVLWPWREAPGWCWRGALQVEMSASPGGARGKLAVQKHDGVWR